MPTQIPERQRIAHTSPVQVVWQLIAAIYLNSELIWVLLFCLIGLVAAVAAIFHFPEIGETSFDQIYSGINE